PGLGSSADFWFAMSASLPPTEPSSISPASGLHSAGVYETRSNTILSETHGNKLAEIENYISVATIRNVEKIEVPPDKEDNDHDYFLAHGTLLETYPTHLMFIDPKELGEN
ncbi:MAG: hypothetical protein ACLQM6_05610, partial [Acidobacteriaceae bacterium]